MAYEYILTETPLPGIGLIRMNRPEALNALSGGHTAEIFDAMLAFEKNPDIRCIVLTGSEKVFAAGADIKQFVELDPVGLLTQGDFTDWSIMRKVGKPVIAAVSGWALGGGCELAMMCDMIVASETAVFGQPEINLGIMPGAGGTQRLTRAVGKAIAMEMALADRRLTAQEALTFGLVNRVVALEGYLDEALKLAAKIAAMPGVATRMIKDSINHAYELTLQEGLNYEKRNFYLLFGTEDKVEGVDAFINKRKAEWKHR